MQLVSIGKGFSLNPVAASAFLAALAEWPGLLSRVTDADRPLDDQIGIFTTRYTTDTTARLHFPLDRRVWQGRSWYRRAGYAMAAVPQTSHHGPPWSSAIDIATGNADFTWWLHNAKRFNFYQPTWAIGVESWHWEHDGTPLAITPDAAPISRPTKITEDEHMQLIRANNTNRVYAFVEATGALTPILSRGERDALLEVFPTLKVRTITPARMRLIEGVAARLRGTANAAGFDYVRISDSDNPSRVYAVHVPTGQAIPIANESDARTLQATEAWTSREVTQVEFDLLTSFAGA